MSETLEATVETTLGPFRMRQAGEALVALTWGRGGRATTPLLAEASRQVIAYGEGRLRTFDLPLAPRGPSFQQAVWREMLKIPYGETRTYGELARALDGIARAVGTACGANPIPIIIPCHRVVAGGDSLGGFSGGEGVVDKRRLLVHEGALAEQFDLFASSPET
jgi:methylated-DNA-[protein]-cysteine S-methyltransferase